MSLEQDDPDDRPNSTVDEPNTDDRSDDAPRPSREELETQLDLLAEENQRLRAEYARVRTSQYRRTALGLAGLGAVAIGGGLLFPGARSVLFILGAIGLFGGLLTFYLTPEQFIAASVGERVYAAFADTVHDLATDLALSDHRVYVPTDGDTWLFVPQHDRFELPAPEPLEPGFVAVDDAQARGLVTDPTGARLFAEFDAARTGPLADRLGPLASQLTDALVEQFELADSIRVETTTDRGQVTFAVTGEPYGALDRFDHPVASFLAVGIARGLDAPVTLAIAGGEYETEYLVTVKRYDSA